MKISQRFSKLLQADVHGLLDQLEEPELALKQAVREMEEHVSQDQAEVQRMVRHETQLKRRLNETRTHLDSNNKELELCLGSNREDLALNFVRRKLESQKLITAIERRLQEMAESLKEKNQKLAQRVEQLEAVRRKVEIFMEESRINDVLTNPEAGSNPSQLHVSDEEVTVALMREKQMRQGGGK